MGTKFIIFISVSFISFSSISQQLLSVILEDWKDGAWENRMQQVPSYSEDGRITKNEIAYWNVEEQTWEVQSKTVFNRDENGILLSRELFKWLPDQTIWQATNRTSYSINELNKPSSVLHEIHSEDGWFNQSIEEYTYDANGNLTERRTERWYKNTGSWVNDRKYVYASKGEKMMSYAIFFWDHQLNDWMHFKKANYQYSEDGRVEQINYDSWSESKEIWVKESVRKNSRGDEGSLYAMEVQLFDATTESWRQSNHVNYEMTDFGKIANSMSKKWGVESQNWKNLQRSTYAYSSDGEMVEEWSGENLSVELFPNPTMDKITIRSLPSGTITIVDALGKVVHQLENNDLETIRLDVSKWEIGVYSVQIAGSEVQKFIKQ